MFDKLTHQERRELALQLNQAAFDTLTEVVSVAGMGAAKFDSVYGDGLAMQYVNMAHDQVMTLVDLVVITPGRPI